MKLFGFEIVRRKKEASLSSVPFWRGGGWFSLIREPFAGAWQRNQELRPESVLAFYAVYACVTRISTDIGKLRLTLVERDGEGIWSETENPAYSPVLRRPNHFQTRNQFFEHWVNARLVHGNSYVLLARDNRRVVTSWYVMDPQRVRPLVAPNGDVFYSLHQDELAGVDSASVMVPASEVIHDRMNTLYHPLCGVSPISACGLAAMQGLHIQKNSTNFFANGSQPGGLITAPDGVPISEADAKMIRETWEQEYTGDNAGKVAVLGNGLKYTPMAVNAVDAELIDSLKLSAENVCSAFHVPAYMVGVAPPPAYTNVEALNLQYYTQTLQSPIEHIESLIDRALGLEGSELGVEFDTDGLIRMDTLSQIKAASDSIVGGGMSPNEARKRFLHLGKVSGGESPYLQQQNYSLEALAKRDAKADPFESRSPEPVAPVFDDAPEDDEEKSVTPEQFSKHLSDVFSRFAA